MATTGRTSHPDVSVSTVETELREKPFLFEFFQAIRLLERLFPDKSPVGGFNPPSAEVVQFLANSTLAFPASEVQSLDWPKKDDAGRMKVNFMGLTGPEGVLPLYYTSLLAERTRAGDRSAVGGSAPEYSRRLLRSSCRGGTIRGGLVSAGPQHANGSRRRAQ